MKQLNPLIAGGGGPAPTPTIDGKTVTPVNDVIIWQKCAGLDPIYNTLGELLGDSGYVRALMLSNNAVDYMVRSTDFALPITLIPTMTSNTTPSGTASASSEDSSSRQAWRAFDNDNTTYFYSSASSSAIQHHWIEYDFDEQIIIGHIEGYVLSASSGTTVDAQIEYYSDNDDWVTIANSERTCTGTLTKNYDFSTYIQTSKIRVESTGSSSANYRLQVHEIQCQSANVVNNETAMKYIGASDYASTELLADPTWREAIANSDYVNDVLNIQVPIMTSNTTPEGTCIRRSVNGTYDAYKAFDGSIDEANAYSSAESVANEYVGYIFTKPTKALICTANLGSNTSNAMVRTIKVQASNDSFTTPIDLSDPYTYTVTAGNHNKKAFILNNTDEYTGYRLLRTDANQRFVVYELQFLGREIGGVQTWLYSADITDKTYTSLSQVLNDRSTLNILFNTPNAVDYIVNCKQWINDIVNNETAMGIIGANNYASNTLLADNDWCTAIYNSTYINEVLNASVPIMTSNTTPKGIAFDAQNTDSRIYKAFAQLNTGDNWSVGGNPATSGSSERYLGYTFDSAITLKYVKYKSGNGIIKPLLTFSIEGSNDNTNWTPLESYQTPTTEAVWKDYPVISNTTPYKSYRVRCFDYNNYYNGTYRWSFSNLQFYGRKDVSQHIIPDGNTVTPTDDIQIWLHCADIWDKSYTTLAEVLADTDILSALITSENAVDYMVRSTTWATPQALVPTMSSSTTAQGETICSSYNQSEDYPAWKTFDNNDTTFWQSAAGQESPNYSYCGFHFNDSINVDSVYVKGRTDTNSIYKVRGSNDGLTWVDLSTDVTFSSSNEYTVTFNGLGVSHKYNYYSVYGKSSTNNYGARLYTIQFYSASITVDSTAMTLIGANNYASNTLLADTTWCEAICNSTYFESVLNVSVPTMTSNTTPEGLCTGTNIQSSYPAWNAFDKDNSSFSATTQVTDCIGYVFTSPVVIKKVTTVNRNITGCAPITFKVQTTEDGVTWTDLTGALNNNTVQAGSASFVIENDTAHLGYALKGITSQTYTFQLAEINFYGREDI